MKQRFRLYRRNGGMFYCHDSETGKQGSLGTKNKSEAIILMGAKNESFRQRALKPRRLGLPPTGGAKASWHKKPAGPCR